MRFELAGVAGKKQKIKNGKWYYLPESLGHMWNEIRRKRYMHKLSHGKMRISLLNQKLESGSDFNDTETLLMI
ncbi:MAG: hypothetical protein KGY80_13360 [Candidatus Thorarchaeota archaeon]|nr:hypothetical protein [Candidatus Thorarchaeota archaeon]